MSDFGRLQELARAAGVQVNPPMNTTVPAVMPLTAAVGEALSCTMGEWSGEPTEYTYQWVSDGAEVGTGASYTPAAAGTVHCMVSATNSAGTAVAPPSNAVTVTAVAMRTAEPATTRTRTTHTETTR
jgi:hypothetical protein